MRKFVAFSAFLLLLSGCVEQNSKNISRGKITAI